MHFKSLKGDRFFRLVFNVYITGETKLGNFRNIKDQFGGSKRWKTTLGNAANKKDKNECYLSSAQWEVGFQFLNTICYSSRFAILLQIHKSVIPQWKTRLEAQINLISFSSPHPLLIITYQTTTMNC